MATLNTIYRIRAQIPAQVVEKSGLVSKASEIGLDLAVDDTGNVVGAWDASLLNLATVLNELHNAGVEEPLVERRVVALTVAVDPAKAEILAEVLKDFAVSRSEDVLSGEVVLRCNVSCEAADTVSQSIHKLGVAKVIATESFEIV